MRQAYATGRINQISGQELQGTAYRPRLQANPHPSTDVPPAPIRTNWPANRQVLSPQENCYSPRSRVGIPLSHGDCNPLQTIYRFKVSFPTEARNPLKLSRSVTSRDVPTSRLRLPPDLCVWPTLLGRTPPHTSRKTPNPDGRSGQGHTHP